MLSGILSFFLAIVRLFHDLHGHDDDTVLGVFIAAQATRSLAARESKGGFLGSEMSENLDEIPGGKNNALQITLVGAFQGLCGRAYFLALGRKGQFVGCQVEVGPAIGIGIEDDQAVPACRFPG